MVVLDFIWDDEIIKYDKTNDPMKEGGGLMITYFWMPIRFVVNGVELSKLDEETLQRHAKNRNVPYVPGKVVYNRMCLLDPAIGGYLTIKELKDGDSIVYEPMEDAGKYYLQRIKDEVHIRWNGNNKETAIANYDELLKAFKDFGDKVRIYLLKEFPGFINHPMFGAWFRGESDTITHR